MKVILLKDMGKLGKEGDVVEARDGYARNYLIPQGAALRAVKENFKKLEEIKRARSRTAEEKKRVSLELKDKIEAISLTITAEVKDDKEEIYGSVNDVRIVKGLLEEGIEVDKSQLVLEHPIKKVGAYKVKVRLHSQVEAELRVWVVKK